MEDGVDAYCRLLVVISPHTSPIDPPYVAPPQLPSSGTPPPTQSTPALPRLCSSVYTLRFPDLCPLTSIRFPRSQIFFLMGYIPSESVRGILDAAESLTEEKIDKIIQEFLEDLEKGEQKVKGWPSYFAPYTISKAALNAYTRILAKKNPDVDINCLCPGYVKTDINFNSGYLSTEEGAASPVRLALMPKGEASGIFFDRKEASFF